MYWHRCGNIGKVSKYHLVLLLLMVFVMSLFAFCHRLGVMEFGVRRIYSGNSQVKCIHLHEIALDMLSNGDKVALPYETNDTRWSFRKRPDLDYLTEMTNQLRRHRPSETNITSYRRLADYGNIKAKDIEAKKYFITFGHNCCKRSKVKAMESARDPGGFDIVTAHDMSSLSEKFRYKHSAILTEKKGGGLWLWKPYIILKTLIERMSVNDLLMYQDADAYLTRDAGPMLKAAQDLESGIVLFHSGHLEEECSKRDSYIIMDMDDQRVYQSFQRLATFVILRKNCQSLQFVMEWLAYAMDPRILTNNPNELGKPNLPAFSRINRFDQTVLSLLSKKWQLDVFRSHRPLIYHDGRKD